MYTCIYTCVYTDIGKYACICTCVVRMKSIRAHTFKGAYTAPHLYTMPLSYCMCQQQWRRRFLFIPANQFFGKIGVVFQGGSSYSWVLMR